MNKSSDNFRFNNVTFIIILGGYAFSQMTSLSHVLLTSGLTIIGPDMFNMNGGNATLSSITIPSTVTFIGEFEV